MHKCFCIFIFSLKKPWNPNKNCRKESKWVELEGFSSHCGSDSAISGLTFQCVCICLLLLNDDGLAEAEDIGSHTETYAPVSGRRVRSDRGHMCL